MRPFYEDGQRLFEFVRSDSIILTNLGVNPEILKGCSFMANGVTKVESVIASYHQRGADELPHRGVKGFWI